MFFKSKFPTESLTPSETVDIQLVMSDDGIVQFPMREQEYGRVDDEVGQQSASNCEFLEVVEEEPTAVAYNVDAMARVYPEE